MKCCYTILRKQYNNLCFMSDIYLKTFMNRQFREYKNDDIINYKCNT